LEFGHELPREEFVHQEVPRIFEMRVKTYISGLFIDEQDTAAAALVRDDYVRRMIEIVKECQDEARFRYDSEPKANTSSSTSITASSSTTPASPFEKPCSAVPSLLCEGSSGARLSSFFADMHQRPGVVNYLPLHGPEIRENEDHSILRQYKLENTHPSYASSYRDVNSMAEQNPSGSCSYEMTPALNDAQGSTVTEVDNTAEHDFTIETEYPSHNVYFEDGISDLLGNNKELDYFDL
jgi:hypothetical protein